MNCPDSSISTRAHTEPPKPAPNAEAAMAPHFRALCARKRVSATWFLNSLSVSSWDRSTAAPNASRSPNSRARMAAGRIEPVSSVNWVILSITARASAASTRSRSSARTPPPTPPPPSTPSSASIVKSPDRTSEPSVTYEDP